MPERIVPYKCPKGMPYVASFDFCQIGLPSQRKPNAVGRYAGSGEKMKADEQQQGRCYQRQGTPPAPQHQIEAEGACDGDQRHEKDDQIDRPPVPLGSKPINPIRSQKRQQPEGICPGKLVAAFDLLWHVCYRVFLA